MSKYNTALMENQTSFPEIVAAVNNVSNGIYLTIFLYAAYFILIVIFKRVAGIRASLVASSFIMMIVGVLFVWLQWVLWQAVLPIFVIFFFTLILYKFIPE